MALPKKKSKKDPNEKLLRELTSEFILDYRADRKWRELKEKCEDFYDGDQWTDEEKAALEARGQGAIVINRIKNKIDAISGMQMEMGVDTKPHPKGIRDFEKAKHMGVAMRHVEQTCDFDSEESDVFQDGLKGGRAWYKTVPEWVDFEPVITTLRLDNGDVVPDRYAKRQDLADAKRVHETIWMDAGDAKKLFPGYDEEIDESLNDRSTMGERVSKGRGRRPDEYDDEEGEPGQENEGPSGVFIDKKQKRVRVVTTQYRESYYQKVIIAPGMEAQDVTEENEDDINQFLADFEGSEVFSQLRYRLHQATYTFNCMFQNKKDIAEWDNSAQFWYTKFQAYRTTKDGIDYGLVKQMLDPQSELNKRRSKALHALSVVQIIRDENSVVEGCNAREEANKVDGEIILSQAGGRFEIGRNSELSMGQVRMLEESKQELDQAGVPRELEGMSNAGSGREFQLKQRSQVSAIKMLFRNLRKARRQVGMLWIKMIQHYYTAEMALKVSDDPKAAIITLNQPVINPETNEPLVDPQTGEPVLMNDVSEGKYDLVVEESAEYIGLESETFAVLSSLAEKGYPIPPEMLISVAPVPNRQEWLAKIQEQQAAQQAAAAGLNGQAGQGGPAAGAAAPPEMPVA